MSITLDGSNGILAPSVSPSTGRIPTISATVSANALTIGMSPTYLDFRSTILTDGTVTTVLVSPSNLIVPSGATLGSINGQSSRIAIVVLLNAGVGELGVINLSGGLNLDETTLLSTTAISTAANLNNVVYSTTARSGVPFRVVGFIDDVETTAGTWAAGPTTVQGAGGQALGAMNSLGYGQTWKGVTKTLGVTYYNTTGKPIFHHVSAIQAPANEQYIYLSINGGSNVVINHFSQGGTSTSSGSSSVIIPPGVSYRYSLSSGTIFACAELS